MAYRLKVDYDRLCRRYQATHERGSTGRQGQKYGAEKGGEGWKGKLDGKGAEDTTQRIIEAMANKPDITQKELAAVIGITEDGVKYHIISLRKKGVIKRINPDKGRYWEIVGLGGTP